MVNPVFVAILALLVVAAVLVSPWFLVGAAAYIVWVVLATDVPHRRRRPR